MKNKKQNIFILIYYAILILIMMSRKDATSEPPMIFRLAFMGAVVFPAVLYKKVSYPAIITLFYTLVIFGFSYSYLPYTYNIYVGTTFFITIFLYNKDWNKNIVPPFLPFFTFYIFIIDLIYSLSNYQVNIVENILYGFLLLVFFIIIIGDNIQGVLSQLSVAFIIITIVLSYLFIKNQELSAVDFGEGLERSGWTDPNYFGCVIGMGTVISMFNIFDAKWYNKKIIEKIFYISALLISVPVLILNASRGALLSVIIVFVILVLFSNAKLGYKIVIFILSIIGCIYLYNNDYFTLLEARILSDDGTGSGRTEIWSAKLDGYLDGNIFQIIFGNGFYGGGTISGRLIGFHNDYLGFLVDYGIVGLCMLLYMLYYPIKLVPKNSKIKILIIASIAYLAICFLTLEPFLTGILPYFSFYLYAFLLAKNEKNNQVKFIS